MLYAYVNIFQIKLNQKVWQKHMTLAWSPWEYQVQDAL